MVLQGADILSTEHSKGFCVLHAACKGGHATLVHDLLEWDLQVMTQGGSSTLRDSTHWPSDGLAACKCALKQTTNNNQTARLTSYCFALPLPCAYSRVMSTHWPCMGSITAVIDLFSIRHWHFYVWAWLL
jgi:hypothetical protein